MNAPAASLRIAAEAAPPSHASRRALRFLTAGSVDDGKSTLIGRLLFESHAILADQIDVLERRAGGAPIDLSLLTDGLEAEREQGITIDVAHRYFATRQRKFIIADAPGHEQYTRNMVTAAAGSDAAVVLVDITKLDTSARPVPLLVQTRRHALLAHLLRVPNIVFAVNKIDALDDPGPAYAAVRETLLAFAREAGIAVAGILPVSALRGDNVTLPLQAPWHEGGPSLLQLLESLPGAHESTAGPLMVPVQFVAREADAIATGAGAGPASAIVRRMMWGRIASGRVAPGDEIEVFPSGERARVLETRVAADATAFAEAGQSVGLLLDRQLDVSRGDWVATPGSVRAADRFTATLAWLDTEPLAPGRKYHLRHGNRWVQGRIVEIESRLDIASLQATAADSLGVNEIGTVVVETQQPLPLADYAANRVAGALIVVDAATHRTSGALLARA